MTDELAIDKASKILRNAFQFNSVCEPIRDLIGTSDLESAYRIQSKNIEDRLEKEKTVITGRKIGLTAKSVQSQLGVDQPDFGTLLHSMKIANTGVIPKNELMQAKAEAEIAFVLAEDVLEANLSEVELKQKIDYAVAAIEVVGSRIKNWDIKITDTIADNASASHYILGDVQKKVTDLDLINCKMQLYKNNEKLSEGTGAACLGSPINAFKWLANKMIEMNSPLKKGDVVLTGALGPMISGSEGDYFKAEIEGLGSVEVKFGV